MKAFPSSTCQAGVGGKVGGRVALFPVLKNFRPAFSRLTASGLLGCAGARITDSTRLLQHPPPLGHLHGGPFQTHGELAQGLSLTMRTTRTASPLCFFSPQWPETVARLLCGKCWPVLRYVFKNQARYIRLVVCFVRPFQIQSNVSTTATLGTEAGKWALWRGGCYGEVERCNMTIFSQGVQHVYCLLC